MKAALRTLLFSLALAAGGAVGHGDDKGDYTLRSLTLPDPIFVTGDSVQVRIGAASSAAIGRAGVRLNGHDVTSAFSPSEEGAMTGTVVGLQPGINTLELFKSKRDRKHPVATLKVARAKAPALACNASSFPAAALPVPNTVVTSVAPVAATATVPAHCLINGTINAGRVGNETSPGAPVARYTYAITWQARLPDAWNSKFHMPGGGGTDGSVPNTTPRLRQGYAAAANDSGHSNAVNNDPLAGGTASFGTDFLARVDFAYNAIDLTTRTAKRLVDIYYGERPAYSYFEGCSMGGREAMMVTQRLPSYFDGVGLGRPGVPHHQGGRLGDLYEDSNSQRWRGRADLISGFGVPFANNTFTNQDLQLVSNAVLKACDHLDGLVDGMVNNSQACTTRRVKPVAQRARVRRRQNAGLPCRRPGRGDPQHLQLGRAQLARQAAVRAVDVGCRHRRLHQRGRLQHAHRHQYQRRLAARGTSATSTRTSFRTSATRRTGRSALPASAAGRSRCCSRRRRSCRRRRRTTAWQTCS